MGNWTITIQGTGAHHNKDYPGDANKMAQKFVEELKVAGQTVESATFTHGGREVFAPSPGYGIGTYVAANYGQNVRQAEAAPCQELAKEAVTLTEADQGKIEDVLGIKGIE